MYMTVHLFSPSWRIFFWSLQEVETEQYYNFFLPELKEQGYDGFFSSKSRARTMSESDRKHVDGCAIFYKTEKYVLDTFLFLALCPASLHYVPYNTATDIIAHMLNTALLLSSYSRSLSFLGFYLQ